MNNGFLNKQLLDMLKNADKDKLISELSKLDNVISKDDMAKIKNVIDSQE